MISDIILIITSNKGIVVFVVVMISHFVMAIASRLASETLLA